MVDVKRIDTPKHRKTKTYWGALLLSWIPFVGFALAANGPIRSIIKVVSSKKNNRIDHRATVGVVLSSVGLIISVLFTVATLNPSPSIHIDDYNDLVSTDSDNYTLSGKVKHTKNGGLTINSKNVSMSDGKFSFTIKLQEGDNPVEIVAKNDNGKSKKDLIIHRNTKSEIKARKAAEKIKAKRNAEEKAKELSEPKYDFNDFYEWVNAGSGYGGCGSGTECSNWAYIDGKCSKSTRKSNGDLVSYFDKSCLQKSYKKYIKKSAFKTGTSKTGDACESDIVGYYHYLCTRFGDMIMAIRIADGYSISSKSEFEKNKQEAEAIYEKIAVTKGDS